MMKKLVRKSVFETNSSSTHSISLASEDKQFILDTIYPDQFGKVYVNGGEFGWEWAKYNDAQTKLDYAYESGVDIEKLERVVKEQTGATEVVFGPKDGYVDHGGYGAAQEACGSDEDTRNYIFNKNSWLFTGNDNSEPDPTFYDVPIFGDGKVIRPVYKYELSIEGFDKKTHFKETPTNEELNNGIESLISGVLMSENGYFFTDTSIEFQLTRPRDLFEKHWEIEQDYSKGYIIFVKEGMYIHNTEKVLEAKGVLEGLNWNEKRVLITEEVLKYPNIAKKIPFTLKEI